MTKIDICQKSNISNGIEIQIFQEKFYWNFEILIEKKEWGRKFLRKKRENNPKAEERNDFSAFETHLVSSRMYAIISFHGWNFKNLEEGKEKI